MEPRRTSRRGEEALAGPLWNVHLACGVGAVVVAVLVGVAAWDLWFNWVPGPNPSLPWQRGGTGVALVTMLVVLVAWTVVAVYRQFVLGARVGLGTWTAVVVAAALAVALLWVLPMVRWQQLALREASGDEVAGVEEVWTNHLVYVLLDGEQVTSGEARAYTLVFFGGVFGLVAVSLSALDGLMRTRQRPGRAPVPWTAGRDRRRYRSPA